MMMMKGSVKRVTKKRAREPVAESALPSTVREQTRTALNTQGFFVIRNFFDLSGVTPALLDEIKTVMRARKATDVIFNGQGTVDPATQNDDYPTSCGDRARLQLFFKHARMPSPIKWLLDALRRRTAEIFPATHEACDHVFLLSEPNCADQQCHADYDPDMKVDGDAYPLGCLIALEADSALNVWPESIDFDVNKRYHHERLALGAGDMLLFRGDFLHSGASYARSNLRVHCFMDVWNATERLDNGTYYMDENSNIEPIH
jgi:hypothetical protein